MARRKSYSKRPHQMVTGTGKVISYDNERQARMFMGMSLYDNGYMGKADAQRHAARIETGKPYEIPGIGTYLIRPAETAKH